jgi:hypothetical protein
MAAGWPGGPNVTANSLPRPYTPPGWATRGGMTLERLAIGMFLLLAIEFVLGMTLGLFVTLPVNPNVETVLTSSPVLGLHILVALLIVGIAIRAVALSRRDPSRWPLYGSALALVSAVIATATGWVFAFDGQSPDASFAMALGFLGVLAGAFVLRGHRSGASLALDAEGDSPVPTPRGPELGR